MNDTGSHEAQPRARIDRLLDAIDLIKADDRPGARLVLRELIREDGDFEHAWLWMSVTVETLDQAAVCLDNVLRVNPQNRDAAAAFYRITIPEMQMRARRERLRAARDVIAAGTWGMVVMMVLVVWVAIGEAMQRLAAATPPP